MASGNMRDVKAGVRVVLPETHAMAQDSQHLSTSPCGKNNKRTLSSCSPCGEGSFGGNGDAAFNPPGRRKMRVALGMVTSWGSNRQEAVFQTKPPSLSQARTPPTYFPQQLEVRLTDSASGDWVWTAASTEGSDGTSRGVPKNFASVALRGAVKRSVRDHAPLPAAGGGDCRGRLPTWSAGAGRLALHPCSDERARDAAMEVDACPSVGSSNPGGDCADAPAVAPAAVAPGGDVAPMVSACGDVDDDVMMSDGGGGRSWGEVRYARVGVGRGGFHGGVGAGGCSVDCSWIVLPAQRTA